MVGRFDSRVQVDNRYLEDRLILEQRGEITIHDRSRGMRMGASFAARQWDDRGEIRLNRLFVEKQLPAVGAKLTVGRTEHSDSLGFYTLDGVMLDWPGERLGIRFYTGNPNRIEDYRSLEGGTLHGIELRFLPGADSRSLRRAWMGWQHHRDETSNDRLNWGMTARTKSAMEYLFAGVYVFQESRLEDVTGQVRISLRSALQYGEKALRGVDQGAGFELDMEQMVRADLYFSLFFSYLWNSRLKDEYRSGVRITWYLDGYRPGKTE